MNKADPGSPREVAPIPLMEYSRTRSYGERLFDTDPRSSLFFFQEVYQCDDLLLHMGFDGSGQPSPRRLQVYLFEGL